MRERSERGEYHGRVERRTYSEDDVAHALAVFRANGGNAKRTASQLGISRTTLRSWVTVAGGGTWQGSNGQPRKAPAHVVAKAVGELTQWWLVVALKSVKAADALLSGGLPGKAQDVRNLLVAGAVATEKHQLLTGGPTVRSEVQRVSLIAPETLRSPALSVIEGTKRERSA